MLYEYNRLLNFGIAIKFPTTYKVKENYSAYYESNFINNFLSVQSDEYISEYVIKTPMELSAGISASFPFITLNGSIKFIDYSLMEFSDGFLEQYIRDKNKGIEEVFESALNWNLGMEITLPYPALKLRGGFIYNPSPYKDDGAEFNKKYITTGIGFPLGQSFIFDFAYIKGWWDDYRDNYGWEDSRVYQDITIERMVFSVSYIFR